MKFAMVEDPAHHVPNHDCNKDRYRRTNQVRRGVASGLLSSAQSYQGVEIASAVVR